MTTQIVDPSDAQVAWAAAVNKLLSDPTRLRIVWTLLHGEHSVNNLAEHVGAPPASVSQHLQKLLAARIVARRRDSTYFYYSLRNEHVGRIAEESLFNAGHVVGGLPGDHVHGDEARRVQSTPTVPS